MNLPIAKLRHAMSLAELLAVVSACSVILTTSTVLLHRVMRAQSEARSFTDVERSAQRLSRQFRQDVHQATVAVLHNSNVKEGVFLQLQLPNDRSLEYSRAEGNVLRVLSQNGKVTAREEFAFPQTTELTVREQGSPKRISLSITTPPPETIAGDRQQLMSYKAMPVSLQVDARINRESFSVSSIAAQKQPE